MTLISRRFILGGFIAATEVVKYSNIMPVVDRGVWTPEGWYSLSPAGDLFPFLFKDGSAYLPSGELLLPVYIRRDTYSKKISGIPIRAVSQSGSWIEVPNIHHYPN